MTIISRSDGLSALKALQDAIEQLDLLFASLEETYNASVNAGNYEIWDERS